MLNCSFNTVIGTSALRKGGKSSLPLPNLSENNINKGRHFVLRSKMHSLRLPEYFGRIREGNVAKNAMNFAAPLQHILRRTNVAKRWRGCEHIYPFS